MLVLSRQRDQTVVIGDMEVEVTVVDIRGDKVRLGFKTKDPKTSVHRKEVYEAIKAEAQEKRVPVKGLLESTAYKHHRPGHHSSKE